MKTIRQTDKLFSSCCILYSLFIISPTKLFFHYRFQQKHMLLVSVIKYSSSYVFYQFTNKETFITGNRKLELRPSHETHFKANINFTFVSNTCFNVFHGLNSGQNHTKHFNCCMHFLGLVLL